MWVGVHAMAFELHMSIPEDSPAGQVVQSVITAEHVSAERAVTLLLTEAAMSHRERNLKVGRSISRESSRMAAESLRHIWDTPEEDEAWAHL